MYQNTVPFNDGYLKVSEVHSLYYEQCGNRDGIPLVFLHGGPGGGISESDRHFFNPQKYHAILFDQRGAGKSQPIYSLEQNETKYLVQDIEKLRIHLNINKWIVFGGSWGSTLALAYAEAHPDKVLALVLRGIFTLRKLEIDWFYQSGASFIYPDLFSEYAKPIPIEERDDFVTAYYKRLTGSDEQERLRCAKAWSTWEVSTSKLIQDPKVIEKVQNDDWALAFARIECHYFVNKGFFNSDSELLDNIEIINENNIPVYIVQGRYDLVCPFKTAWDLKNKLDNIEFYTIDDAGHSAKETKTSQKLVEICDKLAQMF